MKLISYSQHISALVFAFQSCSAQFVAMSGRTLQFLRYRKEKVDLRSLFIAMSFRSVSDSDVTRKSESMTVGVMAGQLGNMECKWSNRKRHCASKYNNIVLRILLLQNIHR